jgi:hypothetical protein
VNDVSHQPGTSPANKRRFERGAEQGLIDEIRSTLRAELPSLARTPDSELSQLVRLVEQRLTGGLGEERSDFVRALLEGTLAPNELQSRATAYGLLPGARYTALRARPAAGADVRELARSVEATGGEDGVGVLLSTIDGDVCGVVSRLPRIDQGAIAGLGFGAELPLLSESFRLATRALETAIAFGRDGVVAIDDLSLRPAILSEGHVGERLIRRHLEPLAELGDFGATLEKTVRSYLGHGLRIDESAKALFVHPNTLRHRIDRFQQLTGADLRRIEDLVEVWWALERRTLESAGSA